MLCIYCNSILHSEKKLANQLIDYMEAHKLVLCMVISQDQYHHVCVDRSFSKLATTDFFYFHACASRVF